MNFKAKPTDSGVLVSIETPSYNRAGVYTGSIHQSLFIRSEAEMDAIIERMQAARAAQWPKPLPLVPDADAVAPHAGLEKSPEGYFRPTTVATTYTPPSEGRVVGEA